MNDSFGRTEEELRELDRKNKVAERLNKLTYLDIDIYEMVFKKNLSELKILKK